MPIPFIGRLNIIEYVALVGSFLLVGFEAVIRILTLALRRPPQLRTLGASRLTTGSTRTDQSVLSGVATTVQLAHDAGAEAR